MTENVTISVMGFIHCNKTSTDNLTNGVLGENKFESHCFKDPML